MDGNNWRAAQAQSGDGAAQSGGAAGGAIMENGDWRAQFQPGSRLRIVNKIVETLRRHLPLSEQEGVQELKKIAVRFEESIYNAAESQQDYLRKISVKMLSMDAKPQNPTAATSGQDAHGQGVSQAQRGGGTGTAQSGGATSGAIMENGDWRALIQPDSRQRVVSKIMETLKMHPPVSGQGVQELKKIAAGFEEKIYNAATSQQDYLRKISLKMLTYETKAQNPIAVTSGVSQAQSGGSTAQSGGATGGAIMENGDCCAQILPDFRQRIVTKIMETLKMHPPVSGQGVQELKKIAVGFEEKIYNAATSRQDYLRKISLKMLTYETKAQNPIAATSGENAHTQGSHSMQSQVNSQGQQLAVPMMASQTQARQPVLQQNIQNNMASTGLQNSASLTPALPGVSNLSQATMPNVMGQNTNMQSMPNVGQNSAGSGMLPNKRVKRS